MADKKSLVIVESPSKARTINKFLGKDFKVKASVGHIIDLPTNKLGVNIEGGFRPEYIKIKGKEKVISELQKESGKADKIYIATDPDREGEAIAYHISSILKNSNDKVKRIEFNEITRNAVNQAMSMPRDIDMARVYSQQARRVLDRIVGYQVSPLLWKTLYKGLSAGRVQSVALRLVCEREQEIRDFKAEEFWTITIRVSAENELPFEAKLIKIFDHEKKKLLKADIKNEQDALNHKQKISEADLLISDLIRKEVKKRSGPPFITSTMQQTAARVLRFSTRKIMATAQKLYEGIDIKGKGSVGLITYMRTDSTRISNEALGAARHYIQEAYGEKFVPDKAQVFRSKKSAQDAHEAIRPTYLNLEFAPDAIKDDLTRDQYRLYNLIWNRFIASQMKPAVFDRTTVEIRGGDYLFKVEGEVLKFEGYLKVYGETFDTINDENGDTPHQVPPGLKKDEKLKLHAINPQQNFTKPPARFSESTLVKELDRQGIGRPSTYAQIITTILTRKYVEKKENKLHATDLGETVNKILVSNFPDIFTVKFTAEMETELDKVAENSYSYEDIMNDFYNPFEKALETATAQKKQIKEKLQETTEITCEKCGKPMVVKWGRNGKFLACSGFPDCRNTKPLEEEEPQETDEVCEKCGSAMVIKTGRFGKFMACSNYPACKNTKPVPLGVQCPKCGKDVVERRSKKGRTFYGCSNYPKCDFVSWARPVNQKCSSCGNNYLLEKYTKAKGNFLQCPECKNVTGQGNA